MILVHLSIFVEAAKPIKVRQLSLVLLHAHPPCSKGELSTDASALAVFIFVVTVVGGPYRR